MNINYAMKYNVQNYLLNIILVGKLIISGNRLRYGWG